MVISSINQAVIAHVITQLKEGNLRHCEQIGFTENELREIMQLTTDEIHHLAQISTPFLKIDVNHKLFMRMVNSAKEYSHTQKLLDRALILGATIELINYYFGSTNGEVSERRRLLGQSKKPGRHCLCNEEQSAQAWYRWQEMKADLASFESIETLDALMLIAEELEMNVTSVWKLVQEWEMQDANGKH
ncbi:DUF2857 domain-containing protein [Pasteurella testudinis]|uniref:DUF2857 domain-containing protein n=1 Tax=Pasteurella testudinis TaxID=761 RepID=UPI004058233B